MENAVVIAADTFIVERKYYICVDFNNAIKVPDTIDEMPNSGNEVPDKTETVPNTMKRMPDSGNEVPDTTEEMPDSEQEQQIYKYVLENSSITTAETVEILDVKHRRARAILLNMVKDGYLRKEGAARSTIYVKIRKEDNATWFIVFTKFSQIISTRLLIMEVDFCPVLCILEAPVLQAFRGISHFVWYCKAVSDLS